MLNYFKEFLNKIVAKTDYIVELRMLHMIYTNMKTTTDSFIHSYICVPCD